MSIAVRYLHAATITVLCFKCTPDRVTCYRTVLVRVNQIEPLVLWLCVQCAFQCQFTVINAVVTMALVISSRLGLNNRSCWPQVSSVPGDPFCVYFTMATQGYGTCTGEPRSNWQA